MLNLDHRAREVTVERWSLSPVKKRAREESNYEGFIPGNERTHG
jgi:hypothetical protein